MSETVARAWWWIVVVAAALIGLVNIAELALFTGFASNLNNHGFSYMFLDGKNSFDPRLAVAGYFAIRTLLALVVSCGAILGALRQLGVIATNRQET